MRLIVAFLFRYLPVEPRQKIYNLVMVNNALVRKEGPLLPTSSHNLAQSMFEIVQNEPHDRLQAHGGCNDPLMSGDLSRQTTINQ